MKRKEGLEASVAAGFAVWLLITVASCSLKQDRPTAPGGISQTQKAPAVSAQKVTAAPTQMQTENASPPAKFVANPFCKACHADFDEEHLVLAHKAAGIGCERCHGESLRHRSDEANVTPPDLMYPKERINPTCMMCHPRQTIQQVDSHRPILEANLSALETPPAGGHAGKYCTDCHGHEHRMKVRAIRWDKCTGKVLP